MDSVLIKNHTITGTTLEFIHFYHLINYYMKCPSSYSLIQIKFYRHVSTYHLARVIFYDVSCQFWYLTLVETGQRPFLLFLGTSEHSNGFVCS